MNRLTALLFLAACSDSNPNATKAGETVLTWRLSESDRESIRAATLADRQTKTIVYAANAADDMPVKVEITLETATVTFREDGKDITHAAPIKLDVKAIDANGFTLAKSAGGCRGPHFDMALPPSRDMILHCTVSAKKPRYDVGFWIYAYGDGRIDDGKPRTIKVM